MIRYPFPDCSEYNKVVYDVVRQIPRGCVATYGQIAFMTGFPQRSRMVGQAMSRAVTSRRLPCHRVVNHAGRTAPGWDEQQTLLEKEGVMFKRNGCVDLQACQWFSFIGDFPLE